MSSISVGELKRFLESYPDNYEVIMSLTEYDPTKKDKRKHSIAFINGIKCDDDYREVRLMN